MTTPPKHKPTKVPLLPGVSLQDYVAALHPSLFTNPTYFNPAYSGIASDDDFSVTGVIIGTAREMFLAVLVSGATEANDATISVPLKRAAQSILSVSWMGPPTVPMPPATLDADGLISLPPWNVYGGDVLITGTILEA